MYKFYNVVTDVGKYNQCKQVGVKQILISYFYLKNNKRLLNILIEDKDIEILIDSGLYSYYNSVKIDEENARQYCEDYISFVKQMCEYENFIGFFELDFDLIGFDYYNFVKPYQKRLLDLTDKIILICQKKRTIEDIQELIKTNVKTIAIPFSSSVERKYFDYHLLIDLIHKAEKKVHLLGCSSVDYLPYCDQSDSSIWFIKAAMGECLRIINNKVTIFHHSMSDDFEKTYNERALKNAYFFSHNFQDLVNKKQENMNFEILRLF